jgi:CheY-like chemotaxis protein
MGHGTTLVFTIPLLLPSDAAADAPPSPPPSAASSDSSSDAPPAPCTPPQPPLQPPPSVEYSPQPMSPSAAVPPSPPWNAGALSVLVAEDDPLSQTVMRKVLSRMGVRFTIVANGAYAVEAFMREHFSLVLLDLHMPVLDGLGAAREMCAAMASGEAAATPIYALTASCSDEERARCAEAGMSGLIPKPIKVELLKSLLRKHARPENEPGPAEPS